MENTTSKTVIYLKIYLRFKTKQWKVNAEAGWYEYVDFTAAMKAEFLVELNITDNHKSH